MAKQRTRCGNVVVLTMTVLGLLTASLLAPTVARADVGWARHKKLYIVPAPGKVIVDGKLEDWDNSARINIFVYRETSELQSARFAMMYDQHALYVSAIVRDPTPMMNRHDPLVDPNKAWDADVCQIYINLDASLGYPLTFGSFTDNGGKDRGLAQLYLWNFTDRQEPSLAMFRGMENAPTYSKGTVPRDKYEAAYEKTPDGQGYTFEYRIP